ncbi:DUF397 domain-containing protein [Actinosynnema sp. CS-041913]|uniref:DUF397 domain-containing protein n=1 Tax=Actinosynnema sp. CS-041913 TaxID=3239917 RepID=UPI003D910755
MKRDTGWFKSSRSAASSDACVEVRFFPDTVGVRDSKNADGPRCSFAGRAWRAFVAAVRG